MMPLLFLIMTFRFYLQHWRRPDPDPVWAVHIFFYYINQSKTRPYLLNKSDNHSHTGVQYVATLPHVDGRGRGSDRQPSDWWTTSWAAAVSSSDCADWIILEGEFFRLLSPLMSVRLNISKLLTRVWLNQHCTFREKMQYLKFPSAILFKVNEHVASVIAWKCLICWWKRTCTKTLFRHV